jgi:hypothetical protein
MGLAKVTSTKFGVPRRHREQGNDEADENNEQALARLHLQHPFMDLTASGLGAERQGDVQGRADAFPGRAHAPRITGAEGGRGFTQANSKRGRGIAYPRGLWQHAENQQEFACRRKTCDRRDNSYPRPRLQ